MIASRLLTLTPLLLALAAPARAEPPDCGDGLTAARGHLLASQRAKEPSRTQESQARAAWASVPVACRGGLWYATAANLLRHPGAAKEPLAAGDTRFETPKDALVAGLSAWASDAELLAYVAYLARIAPVVAPPLPAGSCGRVEGADPSLAAYVCGVEAFAAGRWLEARKHLVTIKARRFPNLAELFNAIRKKTGKRGPKATAPVLA